VNLKTFLLHLKVFKKLRESHPEQLRKLVMIDGDVSFENLGISQEDKSMLLESVNIIFHCAAIVQFDDPLMKLAKVNVKGTHRMLQFAENVKQLKSFVYISTAFSQAYQYELLEKYYPASLDIFEILKWIDSNNIEELEKVQRM
jgi:alcohol-forming fatty acyl-CoA reductase